MCRGNLMIPNEVIGFETPYDILSRNIYTLWALPRLLMPATYICIKLVYSFLNPVNVRRV